MEIRLEGTRLSWPGGERQVGADDEALLRDCARRYRAAIRRGSPASLLLPIGRQLHAWLDGSSTWLDAALRANEAGIATFAASEQPPALENAFIDVPWELLADGRGFLAEDAARPFGVVRRLGRATPPVPPSDHPLSLLFMAGAPRGGEERELDYEAEEVGILDATTGLGLDFWVEESGNISLLAQEVRRRQSVDVLHLSCHGLGGATPALALEDEGGALEWVSADSLAERLESTLPKLLFMSACHTAERHQVADSLATRLVRRGVPAVLGWDGTVGDLEASAFANVLYRELAARRPLEQAVTAARLALLQAQTQDKPSRDWHLARLYLGPAGGGPLAGGTRARHALGVSPSMAYLDEDRQVPVAGPNLFVGRRRQVQEVLRTLRGGAHAGVVVHGFGQQGKSSLAFRVAQRLTPDYAIAPVVGRCDALAVLAALKQCCKAVPGVSVRRTAS